MKQQRDLEKDTVKGISLIMLSALGFTLGLVLAVGVYCRSRRLAAQAPEAAPLLDNARASIISVESIADVSSEPLDVDDDVYDRQRRAHSESPQPLSRPGSAQSNAGSSSSSGGGSRISFASWGRSLLPFGSDAEPAASELQPRDVWLSIDAVLLLALAGFVDGAGATGAAGLTTVTMLLARCDMSFGAASATAAAVALATSVVVEVSAFLFAHDDPLQHSRHFEATAAGSAFGSLLGLLGYTLFRRTKFGAAAVELLCIGVAVTACLGAIQQNLYHQHATNLEMPKN